MNQITRLKSPAIPFITTLLAIFGVCFADGPKPSLPFTLSKETTAITQPLQADGTVDYVAAINQIYCKGATLENNGYVLWLHVVGSKELPESVRAHILAALGIAPQEIPEKGFDQDVPDDLPMHPWKPADNPRVATYLAANDKFLDLAVQASQKPIWWEPAVSTNGMLSRVLLPTLNSFRGINESLCCRALLRKGQGDFDGYISDIIAVKRLTRLACGWTTISRVITSVTDGLANDAMSVAVGDGKLSSAQCGQLAKALDGVPPLPQVTDVFDTFQRWDTLDMAAVLAVGKIKQLDLGDDKLASRLLQINPGDANWDAVLTRLNKHADDLVAILQNPKLTDMREREQAVGQVFSQIRARHDTSMKLTKTAQETPDAYSQRIADEVILDLWPATAKPVRIIDQARMRDEMFRGLVAAAQFHADNSHWPEKLSDLVPKYLPAIPRDIFSPNGADPVHYRQNDGGIYIYSLGVNRNDDGGLNDPEQKQDDIGAGIAPKPAEGL